MATGLKNLSVFEREVPSAKDMKIGIVVAEWNSEVTGALLQGAVKTLLEAGCMEESITIKWVPGTFELPLASQIMIEQTDIDGVIALGCVIQGETRHFDFISQGVAIGITQVQLNWSTPVAFGVLTTDNLEQALDRAGGRHGNKGDEAAATVIKMIAIQRELINGEDNSTQEIVS